MNYKKFGILFVITFIFSIIIISLTVIIIDPYFHYHKPLKKLNYNLDTNYQRYQNDGIVKHFGYDAIITGTSMTENFKTSEFDELFNVNSVKVPLSGAYYKEIDELLKSAFKNNKNIKYVIRSLDSNAIYIYKDDYSHSLDNYPFYLYNNFVLDDYKYILNKEVLINSLLTLTYKKSTSFDEYSNWNGKYEFGQNALDNTYIRKFEKNKNKKIKNKDIQILKGTINQNIISTIKKHPDIEFYIFYPPYSIYQFDFYNRYGALDKYLIGEEIVTRMLLEYKNIHLFSFLDNYDIITNLNNYRDKIHYSEEVNSYILKSMKMREHELTKDNYKNYYDKIIEYYHNYDYDSLFDK